MDIKIKELPLVFEGKAEVKGFIFKQIENNGDYYIYEKSMLRDDGTTKVTYEVFKRNVLEVKGKISESASFEGYSHYVSYPSSSQFGGWAFEAKDKHHLNVILNEEFGVDNGITKTRQYSFWSLFN